jgi:hypothetical protein
LNVISKNQDITVGPSAALGTTVSVFFTLIALLIFLSAGCSKKEVVKPSEESVRADRALAALSEMEKAYEARDLAGVIKPVAQDYKKGYSELQTSLRKDIETYSKADVSIDIDRVEEAGDDTRVVFHWYGRWWDKAGAEHEGRGNTVFIFKETASGPELFDVTGDSPFGIIR